jgi:hypothetical protein
VANGRTFGILHERAFADVFIENFNDRQGEFLLWVEQIPRVVRNDELLVAVVWLGVHLE